MWKLNEFISRGGDEERTESLLDDESDGLCSLSPMQRMYAFAACLVAGLACMFLSLIVFAKPIKFALLFTFGNVLAVGSTAFLIGPAQQIRMMFDSVRIYATAIYIGCVVISLICALLIHSKILTVLAIICEICALIWLTLTESGNNRSYSFLAKDLYKSWPNASRHCFSSSYSNDLQKGIYDLSA